MSQSLKVVGTLLFQPTETAPPAPVPIAVNSSFSLKAGFEIGETGATSATAVPMGTLTKPVLVYIEVTQGTLQISTNVAIAEPLALSVDAAPAPTDKAWMLLYSPAPQTQAFWVKTPGPCVARVWIFG